MGETKHGPTEAHKAAAVAVKTSLVYHGIVGHIAYFGAALDAIPVDVLTQYAAERAQEAE